MNEVKISVIVPVYNVEHYLIQCLDSIVAQTYKNIEIILVDDGSTDNSGVICQKYTNNFPNIRYIRQKNAGLAAARQAGLDIATGTYIGFVDSDDWLEPTMYEEMMEAACKTDSDIIFCNVYRNEDKKEKAYLSDGYYNRQEMMRLIFPRLLASFNDEKEDETIRWCNWLRIYKKSMIDQHSIRFDKRFRRCQDLPFTFECTIHANGYYYLGSRYLYHNRMNYHSLSKGYTKGMWGLIKPLVQYLWKIVQEYKEYDFKKQMKLRSLLFAFECADNEIKPNNVRSFKEKIGMIKEIMEDDYVKNFVDTVETEKLNRTMKIYLFCFRHQLAVLYYVIARRRYDERFRDYKMRVKQ